MTAITRKSTSPARNTAASLGTGRSAPARMHVRGRPPTADAQLGSDLGGDGLAVIDTPKVVLTAGDPQPAQAEPAHRHHPPGELHPAPRAAHHARVEQLDIGSMFRTYIRSLLPSHFNGNALSTTTLCRPRAYHSACDVDPADALFGRRVASGAAAHLLGASILWSLAIGLVAPILLAAAPRSLLATVRGAFTPSPREAITASAMSGWSSKTTSRESSGSAECR